MLLHVKPALSVCLLFSLLMQSVPYANASNITFDDRATFLSATEATSSGSVPMGGGAATSFVIGDLTFTNLSPSTFHLLSPDLGIRIPGFDLAINDVESFNVDSATPLFAFGFDFHEPENDPGVNGPFIDSEFTVTLLNAGSFVDSFMFTRPNDSLQFVGILSTNSFDRVEVRESTGGLENEFFGNFLTSSTPVPEPSSVVMFGVGVLVTACFLSRRCRNTRRVEFCLTTG